MARPTRRSTPTTWVGSVPLGSEHPVVVHVEVVPDTLRAGDEALVTVRLEPVKGIKINRYPKIKLTVPEVEGLVLAAIGDKADAREAFEKADFSGIEFDVSYWPTVSVRYLFKTLWAELSGGEVREELRRRIDESWGLMS